MARQQVDTIDRVQRRDRVHERALGVAHHAGSVVDVDGHAQRRTQGRLVPGRRQAQTGHDRAHRQVPHAVVARAVVTGDARAVQHERDARPVERDVHDQLVERAVEERGVDRHHGVQPGEGHPGRRGHGVLLGDADVERPGRERGSERRQPHRCQHRGRDRHDVRPAPPDLHDLVGEDRRPAEAGRRDGQPGLGMDLPDGVETVEHVLLGRGVAPALLGDDVHDDGAAERLGPHERPLDRRGVVPVHRADVLQAEALEHALGRDDVLDALLQAVQRVVGHPPGHARAAQVALAPGQDVLVAASRAQRVEVVGEAADGRCVRTAVVVDHDHDPAVLARGDVVQRLPGHAAGQGAVTDDRDHVPVLQATHQVGLGDAVGPAQRRRGVRVLHDVVHRLRAARVAREPSALSQAREVLTTGEQLVHVGLVAGVEDHRVARRDEHAVQRERELHDAEVRTQVAPRARDGLHEELTDLGSQLVDLSGRESPDVGGRLDAGEQTHRVSSP